MMDGLADALHDRERDAAPMLVMGTAYGVNTVKIDGLDGTAEFPYIVQVDSGDRVLLARLGDGAYLIIGPVTQP